MRLNAEQAELVTGLARDWRAAAAVSWPLDREATEVVIRSVYEDMAAPMPRIAWVDSPRAAARLLGDLGERAGDVLPRKDQPQGITGWVDPRGVIWVDASLLHQVGFDLEDVDADLLAEIAEPFGVTVYDWYGPPVEGTHGYEADAWLRVSVRGAVRSDRSVPAPFEAWTAAMWVGFYDAVLRLGLLGPLKDAPGYVRYFGQIADLGRCGAGWWWPRTDVCVVSRRPVSMSVEPEAVYGPQVVHRGEAHRLHRDDGPALVFADGSAYDVRHGEPQAGPR
ncbi:DUF6745 domain-containing protein [Catenuloplanes japonicus]|uniref:DUF6745 domain-containing protein n=1 Tax=Catenuloplanes japonicus TaxID=33876 RepID=UPI00052437F4|nr:hypothetical protein [Catenuloplanes japonicus]